MKKVILILCAILWTITASAQASGGQITRPVKKQQKVTVTALHKKQTAKEQIVKKSKRTSYGVKIICNVPSATMYIDGLYRGSASGVKQIKEGLNTIKLIAEGYEPLIQKKNVNSSSQSFSFTMVKKEIELADVIKNIINNMIRVEGGTFIMGGKMENNISAEPTHQVTLSSFSIGKYEVTQEEWVAIMGYNPSHFNGVKHPVESVSWEDCQNFIRILNQLSGKQFRLPTEAEWEFAARGGNKSHNYEYAGSNDIGRVAWFLNNSGGSTHIVGQKQPNELGLYDMSGNVDEWCSDWYGGYEKNAQTNPQGASSGDCRVIRGGNWLNDNMKGFDKACCVFRRAGSKPRNQGYCVGLRLAL